MLLNSAGFLLGVLILALLYGVVRTLMLGRYWFQAWMKGNAVIVGLLLAAVLALAMWDVATYTPFEHDSLVAEVSIRKTGEQQYQVKIRNEDMTNEFLIRGDMWQLDTRMIIWSGLMNMLGMKPAFRLDRLSGRYFTLEQENSAERTAHTLDQSHSPCDIWALTAQQDWLPWIEARQGVGVYMPLVDAAEFLVQMRGNGLEVSPADDVAQKAMFAWK